MIASFIIGTGLSCTSKAIPSSPDQNKAGNIHLRHESDDINHFITYKGFVVYYDSLRHNPLFTVHRLQPRQLRDSLGIRAKRRNYFKVEPRLPSGISATKSDYTNSGYDRGHLVPAGDFVYSQRLKDETFTYVNVCPQMPEMNRGIWVRLENRIRERVLDCSCEAYLITGALYLSDKPMEIGPLGVVVPSHLFKLIYFPNLHRMFAFVVPNDREKYSKDLSLYQQSVDAVEAYTNQDFFDLLSDELEEKLERKKFNF